MVDFLPKVNIFQLPKDILLVEKGIICQQVNCMGVMGAGLAKKIARKYPLVEDTYKNYTKENGSLGEVLFVNITEQLIFANIFGQYEYGRAKQYTDYNALEKGLNEVFNFAQSKNQTVYIPYKIGCGLAGGDWNIVEKIISKVFDGTNVMCFICKYE